MKRIGVVGCGQWGPNHVRTFNRTGRSRVVRCADRDPERLAAVRRLFPGIETSEDGPALARADDIDCLVVATPPGSHHALVSTALAHGKDVLCEKPLCSDSRQCADLVEQAERGGRILMVGHVLLHHPAIRALRDRMRDGALGAIRYLHATRTNPGPIQRDVNAAMDLASHDVAIFGYLLGALPESVSARGQAWLEPGVEDVVFASLRYPEQVLAHVHVSWLDTRKVRRIVVVGDAGVAVWDDADATAPLTLHPRKLERAPSREPRRESRPATREDEVQVEKIELVEPLQAQAAHFLDCVERRARPLSDGRNGTEVVCVLEAMARSVAGDGAPVKIVVPTS